MLTLMVLISFLNSVLPLQISIPTVLFALLPVQLLLTGMYPDMVGMPGVVRTHVHDSWGYLSEDAVTLPNLL